MAPRCEVSQLLHFIACVIKAVSSASAVSIIIIFIASGVSAGIIYDFADGRTPTREIKIKQGKLVGLRLETTFNRDLKPVDVFLGVPYAAAPTGSQRLMPPGSPPHWMGVKMAHEFGPVCPQNVPDPNSRKMSESRAMYLRRLLPFLHNQSEDCLFLNIYAPAQNRGSGRPSPKFPVIVFIHGESFEWNSGNPYDGSVLASYGEVVVVTLNFRLGILGFLRPGTGEHTVSNFGLLDQIAALHWIRENIQEFGGNPGSVTLMGHGTGAACVNYLMVSPVSQGTDAEGLFHRAILMSGTALADWALTASSVISIQVAQNLNCPLTEANDEMAKCLRNKRLNEIMNDTVQVPEFKPRFGPMVDGSVVPNEPFHLTGVYKHLFSRYELLYGVTQMESYGLLDAVSLQYGILEQDRDKKIRTYVRDRFEYDPGLGLAETLRAYDVTRRRNRFPSQSAAETHRDILLDILSDARVSAPMVQTANFHSSANPKSYFYVFSHMSVYGDYAEVKVNKSIHGEELPYVFGIPLHRVNFPSHRHFSEAERRLSETVMTFWTNFVKTGNPNAPHRETYPSHFDVEWPEYDVYNQTYLSLGIPVKTGHHYRQAMMDFWNNHLPALLKNPPPNKSVNSGKTPEMLPEERSSNEPQFYKPMQKEESSWKRFPPIQATQTPAVYGTVVSSGNEKSRSTSTVLLGVDREFGSRLPVENNPGPTDEPSEVETGSSSSFAMSLVIVIGVCLLLVNLCAFAGLYYQRDRLRVQERLMKKRYEDVEPTNNDELYMSQRRNDGEDGEHRTLETTEVRGGVKKKAKRSGDETYEAVRSGGRDVRENITHEDEGGENSFKRWRLSRQCSASTMDPHTKVREWIAQEIVNRCSPRFLRRTKFHVQQHANLPVLQKDGSFDTSVDRLSSAVTKTKNHVPKPSLSALSKPATTATTLTTTTLQRSKVKKVSVAVDATPAARSSSVLKQTPIEQMSKSLEELGKDRCISAHVERKKGVLKRSETCRESLATSSLSPDPSHSPQRDTVLRRSITSVSFQVSSPVLKNQNNGLNISHQHSKSDPVHQSTHFVPQTKPEESQSQILIPQIYDISIDTKEASSSHVYRDGFKAKQMKTFPTSGTHIKFKSATPKKDVGVTASPVSDRFKDVNVTSRDSTPNGDEKLPVVDPLKKIQRRNFPRVLPDLPSGPDKSNEHEKQPDGPERELTPVQVIAAKRRSLPPPANLLVGLLALGSVSQPSTPTAAYQKNIQTQTGRIPPPPPPRISSTLGRKPNNTTPVTSLETTHESPKLKNTTLTSSPHFHQRPEPRVIIKPQMTHSASVTQQRRDKRHIPRVTPNTEDYPLTTSLRQPGVTPSCPSLSRQSSVKSQHEPTTRAQVHRGAPNPRQDDSTPSLPERDASENKLRDATSSVLSVDDTSSNTGTVKRVKKINQTRAGNQVSNPSSSVSKAWYTQYNQLFLSKTKDSDN